MRHAIETIGLVKVFGKTRAVDGIELTVRRGSVYQATCPDQRSLANYARLLTDDASK